MMLIVKFDSIFFFLVIVSSFYSPSPSDGCPATRGVVNSYFKDAVDDLLAGLSLSLLGVVDMLAYYRGSTTQPF